jgi:hypothetical protein
MRRGVIQQLTVMSAVAIVLLFVADGLQAQYIQPGAWAGRWKFNPEKSKFPDTPNVENDVIIKPDGTVMVHEKNSQGKVRDWSYRPRVGEAVPVQGHGKNVTVLVTSVTPYRLEQTWDYDGKPGHSYATLSKNGKVQIFHVTRLTKDGKPFEEIVYFEKKN